MMSHLPEHVSDAEIEEMFSFADKNNDGRISWEEFLVIIFNWISSSTLIDSFSFTHVATNKFKLSKKARVQEKMQAPLPA